MMGIMRKIINTNLYKAILWIFLFMMAVGSGILINVGSEKDWSIKVYDETLSPTRLHYMIKIAKLQKEEFRQKGIVLAGKKPEKDAVMGGVANLLSQHAMNVLRLSVPEYIVKKSLDQTFGQLPPYFFTPSGELNEEVLTKIIAPQTFEEFIDGVSLDAKNGIFNAIVDLSIYTPTFELETQYNMEFAQKNYSVIALPLQKFIAESKEKNTTDKDLEAFYKKSKNNEQFKTPEKRAGVFWKFDIADYGITIKDAEVKSYYEENKAKYLITPSQMQVRVLLITSHPGKKDEVKEKIEALKRQADANPDEFAKLVKDYSEDKDTASKGGLTDFFDQDTDKFDKIMVKAAFESLTKDGQVSTPIKTERGYELIQRVKRNPAKYKDLKTVEQDIKSELRLIKFKQKFQQDAQRVTSQAQYQPAVLTKYLGKYNPSKTEIALDVRKGGIEASHLFKTDLHKYAVFFNKDTGIILKCTDIEKSTIPPLKEVKNKVIVEYHKDQGKKLLDKALSEALQLTREKGIDSAAQKYGTKVQEATFSYKNGKVDQSPILRSQDVQQKVKVLHNPGSSIDVITSEEGLIVRLDSIADRDAKLFDEKKEHLANTLFYAKKYQVKEGFIASLYRRAKLDNAIEMKSEVAQYLKDA